MPMEVWRVCVVAALAHAVRSTTVYLRPLLLKIGRMCYGLPWRSLNKLNQYARQQYCSLPITAREL